MKTIQAAACMQAGIKALATADKKLAKLFSDILDVELVGQ